MQANVVSGRLQLKDGGERLQEGIGATAASLARALGALAQHSAADPPVAGRLLPGQLPALHRC